MDLVYESPCWDLHRCCFWFVSVYAGELWKADLKSGDKFLVKKFDGIVTSVNICKSGNLLITTKCEIISYCPNSDFEKILYKFDFPSSNYRINDCKVNSYGELLFSSFEDVRPRRKNGSIGIFTLENSAKFLLESFFLTPNGIALSVKDLTLWVADTGLSLIYQFDYLELVLNIGCKANPKRVIMVPEHIGRPDGGNLDINHNYWSANLGFRNIACWSPSGHLVDFVEVERDNPTMIAFGQHQGGNMGITYKIDSNNQSTVGFSVGKINIHGVGTHLFKDC